MIYKKIELENIQSFHFTVLMVGFYLKWTQIDLDLCNF